MAKISQVVHKLTSYKFALPKFGSLQGHTSAAFNIGEVLAICKFWQVFETRAHTYFSILVYRDIFLIQAKLAQVQPGPNIINFLELINNLSISNKGSHD